MAVIHEDSRCSLCDRLLNPAEKIVAFGHFITDQSDPLWRYSDSAMHQTCFLAWPKREEFRSRQNLDFKRVVYPDQTIFQLQENGALIKVPVAKVEPTNAPSKILATAKTFGVQLYMLACKITASSEVGSFGEALTKASPHLVVIADANPKLKEALFFEELLFNVWVADLCTKNKKVSQAMFTELINDVLSKSKPGTDTERLSQNVRDIYQQRHTLYVEALKKDGKNPGAGVMSEMCSARLLCINLALPDSAKINPRNIELLGALHIEWFSTLECFTASINEFKIADGP